MNTTRLEIADVSRKHEKEFFTKWGGPAPGETAPDDWQNRHQDTKDSLGRSIPRLAQRNEC